MQRLAENKTEDTSVMVILYLGFLTLTETYILYDLGKYYLTQSWRKTKLTPGYSTEQHLGCL